MSKGIRMEFGVMPTKGKQGNAGGPPPRIVTLRPKPPEWADGLRKLYNSVVEEPLPDSFDDLLKKLDQADHD